MSRTPIEGVNHVTLAVRDLERSLEFYTDRLAFELCARWREGAHLRAGTLWLCLSHDPSAKPAAGYSHLALSTDAEGLAWLRERLPASSIWKPDTSEGASLYFVDPDGHRLEAHVGSLESRLAYLRERPYPGMVWPD